MKTLLNLNTIITTRAGILPTNRKNNFGRLAIHHTEYPDTKLSFENWCRLFRNPAIDRVWGKKEITYGP